MEGIYSTKSEVGAPLDGIFIPMLVSTARFQLYANSKLAQVLYSIHLNQRLPNARSIVHSPGAVASLIFKTRKEGSLTSLGHILEGKPRYKGYKHCSQLLVKVILSCSLQSAQV